MAFIARCQRTEVPLLNIQFITSFFTANYIIRRQGQDARDNGGSAKARAVGYVVAYVCTYCRTENCKAAEASRSFDPISTEAGSGLSE